MGIRLVTDDERRARLARHGLGEAHRFSDPVLATKAMTVLHATEAPTVYLSLWARVHGLKTGDVEADLYDHRSLVKQWAMRRTLFVFPRDLLPAAWGSASARGARISEARIAKEIEQAGIADDGMMLIARARKAVVERLASGDELSAQALREELPELAGRVTMSPDKKWGGEFPIGSRLITIFGGEALIVRGHVRGGWQSNRPLWTSMEAWLREPARPLDSQEGYAQLVARWLQTFGPGTIADLQWWLGSTVGAVKTALANVGAVEVDLDSGETGWVLHNDVEKVPAPEPWAALLPVLDPTVMGWKHRRFYLGDYQSELFDRNGNAGTSAWWNGRIVGTWVQDPAGVVVLRLLADPGTAGRKALNDEAARLTDWLGGERISMIYQSPHMSRS